MYDDGGDGAVYLEHDDGDAQVALDRSAAGSVAVHL